MKKLSLLNGKFLLGVVLLTVSFIFGASIYNYVSFYQVTQRYIPWIESVESARFKISQSRINFDKFLFEEESLSRSKVLEQIEESMKSLEGLQGSIRKEFSAFQLNGVTIIEELNEIQEHLSDFHQEIGTLIRLSYTKEEFFNNTVQYRQSYERLFYELMQFEEHLQTYIREKNNKFFQIHRISILSIFISILASGALFFLYLKERNHYRRSLMLNSIRVQESERRRFAQDLHDGLGADLSAINMYLNVLKSDRIQDENEKKDILVKLKEILDGSIKSTKEIARHIHPAVLKDYGLRRAIEQRFEKLEFAGVQIQFHYGVKRRLTPELETSVFRIVGELINNSLKHAQANEVRLNLDENKTEIKIQFKDDGVGVELDEHLSNGAGLENIKYRVRSFEGRCWFRSSKGNGMEFNAIIPVLK